MCLVDLSMGADDVRAYRAHTNWKVGVVHCLTKEELIIAADRATTSQTSLVEERYLNFANVVYRDKFLDGWRPGYVQLTTGGPVFAAVRAARVCPECGDIYRSVSSHRRGQYCDRQQVAHDRQEKWGAYKIGSRSTRMVGKQVYRAFKEAGYPAYQRSVTTLNWVDTDKYDQLYTLWENSSIEKISFIEFIKLTRP
jgi:hypothetical protein